MTTAICFATLAVYAAGAEANCVITNTADLSQALEDEVRGVHFDITGIVAFPFRPKINLLFDIMDETGTVLMYRNATNTPCNLYAGDRVRVVGMTKVEDDSPLCYASCSGLEVLLRGTDLKYEASSAPKIVDGRHDNQLVRISGTVRDAFMDEIDPKWGFVVLQDGRETVYTCFPTIEPQNEWLSGLIGAKVSIKGLCSANITRPRHLLGRCIMFSGRDSLSVLETAPANPFDVPPLTAGRHDHATIVSGMGRRRTSGRVVAVWHGDRLLLRTPERRIVRVDLAEHAPPAYGAIIDATGNPETDLYRLNLSRAIWRHGDAEMGPEPPSADLTMECLFTNLQDRCALQIAYHGQPVRIRGLVRSLPAPEHPNDRLGLECDKRIVPIDASARPEAFANVEVGCLLEVSGTCLIETENWRPNAPFPRIDGFAIVVRTPEDVRILSRPPWWTPGRLLTVIGALLAAIAGIFTWNRSLNRLAERRGRELTDETVARVLADLKVEERTRLAIELHDALSQNLTGAALEIETSDVLIDDDPAQAHQHLGIASKTVKSCREELRNCLWDLRSNALEEKTMDSAIRRTLDPHVDGVNLTVRFNVPRETLSDNTAHAFLCIIRELVQNAVRHGHAKSVRIAGSMAEEVLKFSVCDDGSGFEPKSAPGVRQGHFGLRGIQERVRQLGGEISVKSAIGSGTKVTISLKTIKPGPESGPQHLKT